MRVSLIGIAAAVFLAGCDTGAPSDPGLPDSLVAYRLAPTMLRYSFVDTSAGMSLELTWLPTLPFYGYNCLGFYPEPPADTSGTFVFYFNGANSGSLQRIWAGVTDTTSGYLLTGLEGSGGTYAVDASNRLTLTWSDGTQARYFHPSAVLRFTGDTLWSDADLHSHGDSTRAQWHVAWVVGAC